MTTTTFFSKEGRFPQLYRFTLRQNAGYFGLSTLLIFLLYPLQYLMEIFKKVPPAGGSYAMPPNPYEPYELYGLGRNFTPVSMVLFTIVFLLLPFVLALMLNSYMHSKKAADVYHALPVRRETLLAVNAAVAMTIVSVPLLLSTAIIAVASAVKFGAAAFIGYQLLDMLCWLACASLIYTVTACVCTRVGTVFDTFLLSGVLFFALPVTVWTLTLLGSIFLYGFVPPDGLWHLALWLSPVLYPIDRMLYLFDANRFGTPAGQNSAEYAAFYKYFPASNLVLALYLLLAVLLLVLAMRLYFRRQSETAETTTSRGGLPTIFQLIGTVIGSIYAGLLFYAMNGENSKPVYFVWSILGGLVVFAVLEVILNRGFRTLKKRIPWGCAMVAVSLVLSAGMMTGGFGYENRVPKLENVDGVQLNWHGCYEDIGSSILYTLDRYGNRTLELKTPENVQAVLNFHKSAIEEKVDYEDWKTMIREGKIPAYAYVNFEYLKSPMNQRREYSVVSSDTLSHLIPLEVSAEFQQQANPFFRIEPSQILSWTVADALGWNQQEIKLSTADNERLLQAVQADWLALDAESATHPAAPVLAHLTARVSAGDEERAAVRADSRFYVSADEDINEAYTPVSGPHTVALLRELRLLPAEPDLSQCMGAAVTSGNSLRFDFDEETGAFYSGLSFSGSMVAIENSRATNGGDTYWQVKADEEQRMREDQEYAKRTQAGDGTRFIEDADELAALAKAVVPTWRADEPYVLVTFYRPNDTLARTVMAPLSKLPVPLQEKLDFRTHNEQMAAENTQTAVE